MKYRLLAFLSLLITGCAGYKIGPIPPTFMADIHSISVPTFKNDTLEPRIEVLVANTIIKQIQQDGTYKVTSEDKADAILEGKITNIVRRPQRSVRGNVLATKEYDVIVTLQYTLVNRATGAPIEPQRTITGSSNYFVSGDIQQDERQALPLAIEDAAVHLVSHFSEGW